MAFSAKLLQREARYGQAFTVQVKAYVDGVLVAPSTALISVWNAAGTLIVDAQNATVNGTTKLITYSIPTASLPDKVENYRIELTMTVSTGLVYYANFLFDVVLSQLSNCVTDDELKQEHPDIVSDIWTGETTYADQIDRAFDIVQRKLKEKGRRPHMIIDSDQVRELIICKSFELIFFNFAKSESDIFWKRYEAERDRFISLFDSLQVVYDADKDGVVDATQGFSVIDAPR